MQAVSNFCDRYKFGFKQKSKSNQETICKQIILAQDVEVFKYVVKIFLWFQFLFDRIMQCRSCFRSILFNAAHYEKVCKTNIDHERQTLNWIF